MEIKVGKFCVEYDAPCTATIDTKDEADLEAALAVLKKKFPSTSFVEIRQSGGKHIEVDWSEKEFIWKDHRRELNRRIVSPLKKLSK